MNISIRSFLIELARKRANQIIDYTSLCKALNLKYDMEIPNHRVQLGDELEKISRYEALHNRPLLSCLVLRKNDLEEGNGFYKMCEELGHGNWKKLKKDKTFQAQIIKDTIEFWNIQDNYMEFK